MEYLLKHPLAPGLYPVDPAVDAWVTEIRLKALPLTMATRGTASVLGFSGGILESGRPADFIVVDSQKAHMTPDLDSVANIVYAAIGADVLYTVVNGQILLAEGLLTTLNEADIRQEAQARAEALMAD